ncbi:hypothetical protein BH24BAC1_BH24BAC1_23530 [soil metagenome]
MKKIYPLFFLLLPLCVQAQVPMIIPIPVPPDQDTTYWNTSYSVGLNFNQAAFSQNWRAGGVNSIAIGSLFNGKANYARKNFSFDNLIDLQYGVVRNEGQSTRKTTDRILLDSKVGRRLNPRLSLYSSLNFNTQFARGYNYVTDNQGQERALLISNFLAPAFITSSWGVEYSPREYFRLRVSPFSPRITIVRDRDIAANLPQNYGVPVGQTVRYEWLAAQLFANYDRKIRENLHLKWRYLLFANYEKLLFNAIDHRMDLTVAAKITEYVNVSLAGILLYDLDQDPGIQYSQTLSLGLLLTRDNKK